MTSPLIHVSDLFTTPRQDLALNACLVFTVHSADGHIVGGASMGLFDGMVSRTGQQALPAEGGTGIGWAQNLSRSILEFFRFRPLATLAAE